MKLENNILPKAQIHDSLSLRNYHTTLKKITVRTPHFILL